MKKPRINHRPQTQPNAQPGSPDAHGTAPRRGHQPPDRHHARPDEPRDAASAIVHSVAGGEPRGAAQAHREHRYRWHTCEQQRPPRHRPPRDGRTHSRPCRSSWPRPMMKMSTCTRRSEREALNSGTIVLLLYELGRPNLHPPLLNVSILGPWPHGVMERRFCVRIRTLQHIAYP